MIDFKWKKGNGAGKRIAGIMLAAVVGFTGIAPAAGSVLTAGASEANAATKDAVQADIDGFQGRRQMDKGQRLRRIQDIKKSKRRLENDQSRQVGKDHEDKAGRPRKEEDLQIQGRVA